MSRWNRQPIPITNPLEKEPVPIARDAAVASVGVGDGRMIPLLILDTSRRPDIETMILAHEHAGPGDVMSVWSIPSRFDTSHVSLILMQTKPSRCVIILKFNVADQGGVVDQIVQAQGVYIQPGRVGDRLGTTLDKGKILVEVPSKEFKSEWDRIFRKQLRKKFRKEGLSRQEAKTAADGFMKEWRQFGSIRMKQAPPSDGG
jgi:hypothetical protein